MRKQIKIFIILAFLILFIFLITKVKVGFETTVPSVLQAEAKPDVGIDEEGQVYVIGTHLFTDSTPYISSQKMMYAARTIDVPDGVSGNDALNYMKVYSRDAEGNWIDALSGKIVKFDDGFKFDIEYVDLGINAKDVSTFEELKSAIEDNDTRGNKH